jgi:hypothetical protein
MKRLGANTAKTIDQRILDRSLDAELPSSGQAQADNF